MTLFFILLSAILRDPEVSVPVIETITAEKLVSFYHPFFSL